MDHYDFDVLDGGTRISAARGVALPNSRAIWSWIAKITKGFGRPGRLIRVTDLAGKIVILVGAATAIRLAAEMLGLWPTELHPSAEMRSLSAQRG